jgi:hypothetical protein
MRAEIDVLIGTIIWRASAFPLFDRSVWLAAAKRAWSSPRRLGGFDLRRDTPDKFR